MQALLFDMDGVLVDVSRSYRQAVRETVRYFSGKTIAPQIIQEYKNRGNLNNDWKLTWTILQEMGKEVDLAEVTAVFQKFYLGQDYDGFIQQEKWLPGNNQLAAWAEKYRLGIVTGRPRAEAVFTLNQFNTVSYFQTIITLDELPEGKDKPDPWGINRALAMLDCFQGYYVGDSVDDMTAARAAGLMPVGFILNGHPGMKKTLLAAGADKTAASMQELEEIL